MSFSFSLIVKISEHIHSIFKGSETAISNKEKRDKKHTQLEMDIWFYWNLYDL